MATVLEVRGLTRMIELPPKPPKPPVVLDTPALGAAASPADSPSMLRLDSGKAADEAAADAAAKLEEEKKAAAAAAAAREDLPRMRVIFSNVSFTLARGTTLALVGPAKCGKTQARIRGVLTVFEENMEAVSQHSILFL